ncbi:HAD family hydrolase [Acidithiobacillus ferrivorans]|uniref:HAD family hydrolase n=1 Tax=Acidithiobacillus ferrivorans TaxID=160808 RepID=A0A7T4WC68_9PROT|nr:HAD family hydrolase [Acidithiobacillus ferrivorans]QQD71911.1 HAD family hydrolase [Acidithiobacillus ferrivorans]
MNASSVVALDVDGVLGDYETHWRECAEEVLCCRLQGRPLLKVSEQHNMGLRYGLTGKDVDAVWRAFNEDPLQGATRWADLPLYDHASELVLALEDLGCTVWAVTSIDVQHRAARAESLAGLIPAGRIVCVGFAPGTGHAAPAYAKANVLRDLGAVAFLDDHPANTNAAIGSVPLSVLLDRGYHGLEAPEYGVTVIDDPMDFPVLVESLLMRTGRAA